MPASSFGSTALAVVFPRFIRQLVLAGASTDVVGRLKLFHELNKFRVLFRFVFALCCLIAGVDANTEKKIITTNMCVPDRFDLLVRYFVDADLFSIHQSR